MITHKEIYARHVMPGDKVDDEAVIDVKYHLGKVVLRFDTGERKYNDTTTVKVIREFSSL